MNRTQLDRAEERMQQKWYDLVTAEQRGDSPRSLERMFNAYMLAVEEYNRLLTTAPRQVEQGSRAA